MVKICGITRIRSEEAIIRETLDHFQQFCTKGIFVYDDCSTDGTVEICENHPAVKKVIRGDFWDEDRTRAEYTTRQRILEEAQKENPDWILYFDADERIDCDIEMIYNIMRSPDVACIYMQLFDAYITKDDFYDQKHVTFYDNGKPFERFNSINDIKPYSDRKWFGREYREIGMFYRNTPHLKWHLRDQRIATYMGMGVCVGKVKHYGKAISIKQWEDTCDYYIKHFPEPYKTKWKARKGKAIHEKSDFDTGLITWEETDDKGVLLEE